MTEPGEPPHRTADTTTRPATTGTATTRPTTQALVDLVLDPRDPGYEAAARRRGGRAARHWYDRPTVAAGFLVIGFVLAVAWVHTHRGAPEAAVVHDRLVQRVRAAEAQVTHLAGDEAGLADDLDRARAAALGGSGKALLAELNREQLLAGQVAATGPGIEVRLAEPSPSGGAAPSAIASPGARTPSTGGHILIDRDVRAVVNELWADGAEAIAVNGIRLTPTSAIRFAGDAVLVDLHPIASPYLVDALGDTDALVTRFASSATASRYQTLASARGIGFGITDRARLTLPAAAPVSPRYARAVR